MTMTTTMMHRGQTSRSRTAGALAGALVSALATTVALITLSIAAAGCYSPTFTNGLECSIEGKCPRGQVCAADKRCYNVGEVPPFTDAAVPDCQANQTVCENDIVAICDANGNVTSTEPCPLGCNDSEPRCNRMVASNSMSDYFDEAKNSIELTLSGISEIKSDTGEITTTGPDIAGTVFTTLHEQIDGVDIRVIAVKKLVIGGTLQLTGFRPIAIVSSGPVIINGVVFVRAGQYPCGNRHGFDYDFYIPVDIINPYTIAFLASPLPGTAGGSFFVPGASGGSSAIAPGQTGQFRPLDRSLVPLPQSCGSSSLASKPLIPMVTATVHPGAQAGGVLQIVSAKQINIGISAPGSIRANGKGGPGGPEGAGVGGGAGGGILLEAPQIEIGAMGGLSANGGGGSCREDAGENGQHSLEQALGGTCIISGSGGRGGSAMGPAKAGQSTSGENNWAGGGGGAVGIIRINSRSGEIETSAGTILSPMPEIKAVAVQ